MVFETNVTYDYSFYYKQNTNVNPSPKTHNDVYYHRMQESANPTPSLPHSMNMGSITRDKNGEAYYEFIYSPLYPKKAMTQASLYGDQEVKRDGISYYLKRWFCCYG
jgi:hypothetical protein